MTVAACNMCKGRDKDGITSPNVPIVSDPVGVRLINHNIEIKLNVSLMSIIP